MTSTEEVPKLFKRYEALVAELCGYSIAHRSKAQKLHEGLPPALQDDRFILPLFECFSHPKWARPNRVGSNWLWNVPKPPDVFIEGEVLLERQIAWAGGECWSYQMATMSGLFDESSNKRRSIDLVRYAGPGEFEFIELKTTSNNPVYAAFEILGYGLAYCQARQHSEVHSKPSHREVLKAKTIRLVVLAPEHWYTYKVRGEDDKRLFALGPLTAAFNAGLQRLLSTLAFPGLESLTFQFRQFVDEELLGEVVAGKEGGRSLVF